MLARYSMKRGTPAASLPAGVRQDTRKHTRHILRPPTDVVEAYLAGDVDFAHFRSSYRTTVQSRLAADPTPFDALAQLARTEDVYLGCSCPTKKNPSVRNCHTWLALELMAERYPDLDVRFPDA